MSTRYRTVMGVGSFDAIREAIEHLFSPGVCVLGETLGCLHVVVLDRDFANWHALYRAVSMQLPIAASLEMHRIREGVDPALIDSIVRLCDDERRIVTAIREAGDYIERAPYDPTFEGWPEGDINES